MADNKLQYDENAQLDLTVMDKLRFQTIEDFIFTKVFKDQETLVGNRLDGSLLSRKAEYIEQYKYIAEHTKDFVVVEEGGRYKIMVKEACKLHYDNPDFEHNVTLNVKPITMVECLKPLNFNSRIYHDSHYDTFISGIRAEGKLFSEESPVNPVEIVIDCAGSEIKVVRFVKKATTGNKYIVDLIEDQGELTIPDLETDDYEEYVNKLITENPNEYLVIFLPRQHHIPEEGYLEALDVDNEDVFIGDIE